MNLWVGPFEIEHTNPQCSAVMRLKSDFINSSQSDVKYWNHYEYNLISRNDLNSVRVQSRRNQITKAAHFSLQNSPTDENGEREKILKQKEGNILRMKCDVVMEWGYLLLCPQKTQTCNLRSLWKWWSMKSKERNPSRDYFKLVD